MTYYDDPAEEMEDSPQSYQPGDGSRRGRTLYPDASSAHRSIMRVPGRLSNPIQAEAALQESPLAHKTPNSAAGRSASGVQKVVEDFDAMSLSRRLGSDRRGRSPSTRDSSPHSARSNPFDLSLSEDGAGQRQFDQHLNSRHFDNIDALVARGRTQGVDSGYSLPEYEAGMAVDGEGADAQAYVPDASRPRPFRFLSTLTSCFLIQDCPHCGARHHNWRHRRRVRLNKHRPDQGWL
jgi:hypothetical protein